MHDRDPETLEVLSDRLGLTRERVRQIQNRPCTSSSATGPHGIGKKPCSRLESRRIFRPPIQSPA